MKPIPAQDHAVNSTIEYEFDVASLLSSGDSISNVVWQLPSQLVLVNSVVSGTRISAFITTDPSANLFDQYWVTFKVTSVGSPTPVTPELSFEIRVVNRVMVMVV